MRTLATKQPKDSTQQEQHGNRARSPLIVNGGRSHNISPLLTGMPQLQRKCACGGGCPRCDDLTLQTNLKINEPGDRSKLSSPLDPEDPVNAQ